MHHAAWVIPPLLAVVVLVWSGVAKLGSGASLQSIIASLRLPAWLLPSPLAQAMPAVEIALACGLLAPWLPVYAVAAVATWVLFVVYWALIARGLTITPRPTCGCFGQAGDHRISGRTLLRNTLLVLTTTAAVALAASGRTIWSLLSAFGLGEVLWVALAALAWLVVALIVAPPGSEVSGAGVLSRVTDMVRGLRGPAVSDSNSSVEHHHDDADPGPSEHDYIRAPIPAALLHAPDSGPVTLLELASTRAQLLVFVNCYCASTREAAEAVEGWQERLGFVDVHLVFSVPIPRSSPYPLPPGTLLDHAALTWTALALAGSPSAVLLGADDYLAGGPVSGMSEVAEFVDDIAAELSSLQLPEQVTSDR